MTPSAKSWSCVGGKAKCNLECLDGSIIELVFSTYLKIMLMTNNRNEPTELF